MTIVTYSVAFDPLGTDIDITDSVERLEWTEIGSGEVRSATIRLNSQFGAFITNTNLGKTPILDEFNQIRIFVQDRNSTIFDTIYEVDILRPINDTQQGTVLEVELLGREYHLTKVNFAKPFFFESAFNTSRDIIDFYNDPDSKGSLQPQVLGGDTDNTNLLPKFTANEFRFDLSEQSAYSGLMEVTDRMGSSVAAGGGGDFWEVAFIDIPVANQIIFHGYISGNPPDQQTGGVFDPDKAVTITDSLSVNPAEEEGGIESTRGTVVGTWGSNNFGSLPVQFMEFNGALEAFRLYTFFDNTIDYPLGTIVLTTTINADGDKSHFRAFVDIPAGGGDPSQNANWVEITFDDYLTIFGINTSYSLWTNNQSPNWRAAGANPAGVLAVDNPSFDTAACWDSNLIIVDEDGFRTNAEVRAISTANVPSPFKYLGTTLYRGFRIYVDTINLGNTGVPFNQNGGLDRFGNLFKDNVVTHNGGQFTGAEEWRNWDVFRAIVESNMIAIDNEGKVYQRLEDDNIAGLPAWDPNLIYYQPPDRVQHNAKGWVAISFHFSTTDTEPDTAGGDFAWQEITTIPIVKDISADNSLSNDCYHPLYGIDQDAGYLSKPNVGNTPDNFGTNSAVRYTYFFRFTDYGGFLDWLGNPSIDKPKYYRIGAWANFKFPFPHNSYQGGTVGELYGNNTTKFEPVTLDTTNMHLNHSGGVGFNNVDARDLGALESLVTFQKFRYKAGETDADQTLIATGNFEMRCTCYDTSDNVVTQDFTIPFNNQWTAVVLPLSDFHIYRARTPAKWATILKPFLKDREILNVFEWKNLKKICWQWLKPYDEQGRYDPNIFDPISEFLLNNGNSFTAGRVDWSFDGFYFSKNDLAITAPDTERSLQPTFFDEPLISNHISLVQSNDAKLEITSFRHKQYEIGTEGIFDIDFPDSFFLENKFLVNEADKPDGIGGFVPNTIKLVAKKIVYTIDKTPQGAGGFLRTITGVKRFE